MLKNEKNLKIEAVLEQQGIYASTTNGISMYPLIRNHKDTVIITPCHGRLKKYDVPLYVKGQKYVLHRIIKILPDSYIIRGDNCMTNEYGITDEDIIGVLTGLYRGDKQVDLDGFAYKVYVKFCIVSYPVRYIYYRIRGLAGRIKRKITGVDKGI